MRIVNCENNIRALAAALIWLAATAAGAQAPPFATGVMWESATAEATLDAAVGDIDLDGYLDLLFANLGQADGLHLGNGRTFAATSSWPVPAGRSTAITAGDVDGDGDLDVVVATETANHLYLNNAGTLDETPAWSSARVAITSDVVLGDVDGDGILDLVCADGVAGASFYRGTGGSFEEPPAWTAPVSGSIVGLALGDVDGNGRLDLVCANGSDTTASAVYLNDGVAFADTSAWSPPSDRVNRAVALGDMDGDGLLDIVCANSLQPNEYYLNTPSGFGSAPDWSSNPAHDSRSVALGDVAGTGRLAMVFGNAGVNTCYTGGADPVWTSGRANGTFAVVLVDADLDGRPEVVCGNAGQTNTAYENITPPFDGELTWIGNAPAGPLGVAVADVDGDGGFEFAAAADGANALFRPDLADPAGSRDPVWQSVPASTSTSVAFGDMDGNGTPDLVFGNTTANTIYFNSGGALAVTPGWTSAPAWATTAVAVGDIDGDGRLDLVCANASGENTIYFNSAAGLSTAPGWTALSDGATDVALGDIDGDGDLDLVFSNTNATANTAYRNDDGVVTAAPVWTSGPASTSTCVALGDVDGDGDLDAAFGNAAEANTLYLNDGKQFAVAPAWSTGQVNVTRAAAFGDIDNDGDLDLVFGNQTSVAGDPAAQTAYMNDGGMLRSTPEWAAPGYPLSMVAVEDIALVDMDRDGDLDVLTAAQNVQAWIHPGRANPPLRGDPATPVFHTPNSAAFVRAAEVVATAENLITLEIDVADVESDPVRLHLEFQFDGMHSWRPVNAGGGGGVIGPLATAPMGIAYQMLWDVSAVPFDPRDVILRVRAAEIPGNVSVVTAAPAFVKRIGPVTPVRPEATVLPEVLSFATVTVGDTASVVVTITNNGNADLEVANMFLPSAEMFLNVQILPVLAPGASADVTVHLAPRKELSVTGDVVIESNDPLRPLIALETQTNILALEVASRLLAGRPQIPLGEAATVIVEPLPGVRVESAYLYSRSVGEFFFREIRLGTSGDDFIGLIPGAVVTEGGIEYYVEVYNSEVVATDPPGAPKDSLFFQEVLSPTAISSAPRTTAGNNFISGQAIAVDVVLQQGTVFSNGTLYYRVGGEERYSMTSISVEFAVPSATIPQDAVGSRGLDYWIEVETATTTLLDPPLGAPHSLPILVPNLVEPEAHPGGAYRLFSIPLIMDGSILGALADDLGGVDNTRWRLFGYHQLSGAYTELPSQTERQFNHGNAYWLVTRDPHRIGTGDDVGRTTDTAEPYSLLLHPGYNLIGSPFNFPVEWGAAMIDTFSVLDSLAAAIIEPPVGWTPRGYEYNVKALVPFDGYWINNISGAPHLLKLPPVAPSAEAAPARAPAPEWSVSIVASAGDAVDAVATLGGRPDARAAWDRYDRSSPPPPPGPALGVCFPHGEWDEFAGRYVHDIRSAPPAEGGVWLFDVAKSYAIESGGDAVTLSVHGVDDLGEGVEGALVDRRLAARVDAGAGYRFYLAEHAAAASGEAARFALIVGDREYVDAAAQDLIDMPRHSALHQNHPNPFNPATVIRFDLAERARVSLRVYDVRGALVRDLDNRERGAGRYEIGWDGTDNRGTRVASGVYFYRLEAGSFTATRKMVLLK